MMYYKEVLKGIRQYRKDIRVLARTRDMYRVNAETECESEYWRGMRDAYRDCASRASDMIDCYEVR